MEPVLGTLVNFLNMKKINSRGMTQANKHVLMAALTYNLKKYLNFNRKKVQTCAAALQKELESCRNRFWSSFYALFSLLRPSDGIQEKNTGRILSTTTTY